MGKRIANPVGTFWSAVIMLEQLGEPAAANRLMKAIERVTADALPHPQSRRQGEDADVTAGWSRRFFVRTIESVRGVATGLRGHRPRRAGSNPLPLTSQREIIGDRQYS